MAPGVVVCSHESVSVPMGVAPSTAQVAQVANQPEFVAYYQGSIQPRLSHLLALLGNHDVAKNLILAQIWTYLPVLTENKQLLKAEQVCLIGTSDLQDFHSLCCFEGVLLSHLGPMGKVWKSGVVQVVQDANNLSTDSHPRNRLAANLTKQIGEIVYVPVYDCTPDSKCKGVVAVIELVMTAKTQEVMVVANVISNVAWIMEGLQLSLSSPFLPPAASASGNQTEQQQQNFNAHQQPGSLTKGTAGQDSAMDINQPMPKGGFGMSRTMSLHTLPPSI